MDRTASEAALLSLDAVVIDTETTGLDPRKARIVELAAIRLAGGRLSDGPPYRQLLRPGNDPIPPETTRIHHIDDAMVAAAPLFSEAWPQFRSFAGEALVIGHTIGFDLAMLRRECELAGLPWMRPRTLDTRLLAQIVAPDLAGYTLDKLAIWLGVEASDRHAALGDALTTARIFLALIPLLRDHGIRTVAQAERACLALTEVLDGQLRAGWIEPVEPPARRDAERTLQRFDSYPYRHRVSHVMRTPAVFVAADVSVTDALQRMADERISSLYVRPSPGDASPIRAGDAGIVTERDVLRAIARTGADALQLPVGDIASRPLAAVPADAFVYRAIGRMDRLKTRHLGVVDERGHVVGALSARDLLRLRAGSAIALGDEIDDATDAHGLALAWGKLPQVAQALLSEKLTGRDIAEVISHELAALTRQAAVIAERAMRDAGQGAPPCRYAVLVLGSAGRGESLLAMDQDNALVFTEGEPDGAADRWFAALGSRIADLLHEAGVPYCKGGVMASTPQWRGSVATWHRRIADWIDRSQPQDLLSVDIFFDLRPVHGDGGIGIDIWRAAFDVASGQTAFAKLLVELAGEPPASMTLFGNIRTEQGRIDLKKAGLFGIVTAARALAIRHHVVERATPARLAGMAALAGASDIAALDAAQALFLDLILAQQIDDIGHGLAASNAVDIRRLSAGDRDRLKQALAAVATVPELTRDLLFATPG
jgi:DNA polymerase-3 subunit epsilon/CBS domain-containing protein